MTDFSHEGFRAAPTIAERVHEAAKLFGRATSGNHADRVKVNEAFSTPDFPILLAKGFEYETIQAEKDAVREYEPILYPTTHPDFRPKKLRDLFGKTFFEDVAEGEEYKADTLDETEIEAGLGKTGRTFKLTWELRVNGDFTELADFPKRLGNAATETENRKVTDKLTTGTGWDQAFFGTVDDRPFNADTLDAVLKEQALKDDWRGDPIDTTNYVLVYSSGLRGQVLRILNATELELSDTDTNGTKQSRTRVKVANPFKGLVTPLEVRDLGRGLGANRATGWALIPAKSSALPALVLSSLAGHEQVDIRVKADQGNRIGGGAIAIDEGSFLDDTIEFRGRKVIGVSKGFTDGVYASNGQ